METNTQLKQNINTHPMTVGDWIVTLLLSAIPLVNFVLLLVWAFSSDTNINKKNYAKACLIFISISIVFLILFIGCSLSLAATYS